MLTNRVVCAIAGAGIPLLAVSNARAGMLPIEVSLWADGELVYFFNDGTEAGATQASGDGWSISGNFSAESAASLFSLFSNFQLLNSSTTTTNFSLQFSTSADTMGMTSLTGGSVAASILADDDGGTLTLSDTGVPVYQAFADNSPTPFAILLPSMNLTVGMFGIGTDSGSFGVPIPSAPGPVITATMGIALNFSLTAGDTASFVGVLVVQKIPTPGTLAILCSAGLLTVRRRRR